MNWKEFLKPTVGKGILFLLIPAFWVEACATGFIPGPAECKGFPVPLILAIFDYWFYPRTNNYTLIIAGIVVSYLISSGIVSLYHKIRKK